MGGAGLSQNPGICTVDYLIQRETSRCRCLDICWAGLFKQRDCPFYHSVNRGACRESVEHTVVYGGSQIQACMKIVK